MADSQPRRRDAQTRRGGAPALGGEALTLRGEAPSMREEAQTLRGKAQALGGEAQALGGEARRGEAQALRGDAPALRRDAERNRRRILEEARRLYAEVGLTVSHDDIARAAGVGVGTVYRRFPDKESLLAVVFAEQVDTIVELARAASNESDPWRALHGFLERTMEMQAADRGLKDLLVGTGSPSELARDATMRIAPVVARLIAAAQADGRMRRDVTVADVALVPLMVSAVADRARGVDPEAWRRPLALLLDGFRASGATPLPTGGLAIDDFARVLGGEA